MLNPDVKRYLDDHRDDHLERLCQLLRFASDANSNSGECSRCADWLIDHLTGMGLHAQRLPTGGQDIVFAQSTIDPAKPTLLIYGHYDVQPADPLEEWLSPPFEPTVREGNLYARGASDDKGQLFLHLMAIEAWQQATGELPVNVKVFIEGEEEIGSPTLEAFIADHLDLLAADAVVVSDSAFFAPGVPALPTGLRGLTYLQIDLEGPAIDLHSGIYGGIVANPLNVLVDIVAAMRGADGKVTIPGFYDDVIPVGDDELASWASLPFDEVAFATNVGLESLGGGEEGLAPLLRRWGRPTLDVHGVVGGYTGPGAKTVIPARASAKISMRLVANQDPDQIVEAIRQFVADRTPAGIRSSIQDFSSGRPVLLRTDGWAIQAGKAALTEAFNMDVAWVRYGASVPVTEVFQRLMGLDSVMLGFGLPDDALHSPNEKLGLEQFYTGAVTAATFLSELAKRAPKDA
jgi:acetylornithine deacetylase/succinyl-diaminopimelate desuccinylase-like protein